MFSRYIKLFWKTKKGLKLVCLSHFLHDFWIKIFFTLYFINWPNFIARLFLILEIWVICFEIIYCQSCNVINLQNNHGFLIKLFLYMIKKARRKFKYIKNKTSFFSSFLKGFNVQKLSQTRAYAFHVTLVNVAQFDVALF